jgi:hypothetical protein
MSLFRKPRVDSLESPKLSESDTPLPVTTFDLSKRYDLYCAISGEDRLYEDVRIIGIKTFERKKPEYMNALIGGYLEIEARNGTRMMLPHIRMYMICEHGSQPAYKLLRVRKTDNEA